jgi:hypothetical protein
VSDLDDLIAEQVSDPVFARAYELAEAVARHRAWRRGVVAGMVLDLAAIAVVLVLL